MTGADFWSRRKAQVAAAEAAEAEARTVAQERAMLAERDAKPDADILAEFDLPDPDTLRQGDDFSAFLQAAVPERLRRRALRRLWLSNPALANLDALVDYGEDYTDAATVVANLQTAYQVGRGIVRRVSDMAEAAADEDASRATADSATPDAAPVALDDAAPRDPPEAVSDTAGTVPESVAGHETTPTTAPGAADSGDAVRPGRRMRFAFDAAHAAKETA